MSDQSRRPRGGVDRTEGSDGPVVVGGRRRWYRRWWALLLVIPALVGCLIGLIGFFIISEAVPLPAEIGLSATTVFDRDGNEIGALSAQGGSREVSFEEVPEHLRQAVLAAEDRGFYDHGAISIRGVARALFTNARAGEIEQGGSTISQQYIKNSPASVGTEQSFLRKAKEAALAIKLERQFDKDEILTMYLNTIYWGRGAYGIDAAARTYYDVPAGELDLNQSVTLAGIIQAPERLDPADNPEGAESRRRYTLAGMLEKGWIDQSTHDELVAAGLPQTSGRQTADMGEAPYYLDAVHRELLTRIDEQDLYRGLRVHTAMSTHRQRIAEQVMQQTLADQPYTGAMVSLDPRTGEVHALVGGRDFAEQQFNTAVRAARQVGSAFKPVTLATLVEQGVSPATRVDAPACLEVDDVSAEGGTRELCNYDQAARGQIDLYEATVASVNTAYLNAQEMAGVEQVAAMAQRLGLPAERDGEPTMPPVPSLTLGSSAFTPLEMTGAYATFAANGQRVTPHLITRIEDSNGTVLFETDIRSEEVLAANDAAIVTDVLTGVIERGTATSAQIGRPAAGKTGTTNDYTNAWFIGYVPQLVTTVWIGNLEGNTPLVGDMTGGSVPAAAWTAYMQRAMEGIEPSAFPEPDLSGKRGATPSVTPTESETIPVCEEGMTEVELPEGQMSPCPSPSPTVSPSPTESPTRPEPEPQPTATEAEPSPEPSPEPSAPPSESPEPEPTPTGDGQQAASVPAIAAPT